ncbi:hypothetical protein RND71_002482 [Anisodus tanguticus]|uniref:Aluminum-activated malate transporter n=1 Tax=Anisodus tanguticus TaxID=243964 RepID=A0AAE1VZ30_9SOLA|nr:hypothetical protein RND71_002482 [Anisodus tanguticus]
MEIDSTNQENVGVWTKLKYFPTTFKKKVGKIAKNTKQIGKDDPRKIWHAFKVALALSLVSLVYYTDPLYDNFDQPAMWAVLTVVVVFEFTAAGAFGLGVKYLAELIGEEKPDPIVLAVLVFIVGAFGTFTRFYPRIKRRYDYGTMIFVLTFSLVAVSSYRSEDLFLMANRRVSTILIGVSTVMVISMIICPVWAGDDLHKLANLAWWEPPHGPFKLKYPWKLYLKIGVPVRKCACHLLALSGHLNRKSQAPTEFEKRTEEACKRMITESSKALKELALSIETMTQPIYSLIHIRNAKNAIDDLKDTLGTSKYFFRHDESHVMDFAPAASVVSLLVDVIKCVDEISEVVQELSGKACFVRKERRRESCSTEAAVAPQQQPPPRSHQPQLLHRGSVNPVVEGGDFVTIELGDNVELAERVVVEEANQVNNPLAIKKGGSVVIGIRGNTSTTIVEAPKKGEFINLVDTKFYDNTKFLESTLVTATKIVEEMKTADKKREFMNSTNTKFYDNTKSIKSILIDVNPIAGKGGLSKNENCK